MNTFFLILIAILPVLFFCVMVVWADRHERESFIPLLISFGLGMLIVFPVIWIEERITLASWFDLQDSKQLLLYVFIAIALTEELFKGLCVFLIPYRQKYFNEPFDGVVYAVMVSMGFAVVENVNYVLDFGLETGIARALTAIPAHATFGIISGYYFGRSKFDTKRRWPLIIIGFFAAIILHTLYDFFILQEISQELMIGGPVSIYMLSILCFFMVRNSLYHSPFKSDKS